MASQRTATLTGLAAILLWASLAVLTTATGNLPPFQVLAVSFGIASLLGSANFAATIVNMRALIIAVTLLLAGCASSSKPAPSS